MKKLTIIFALMLMCTFISAQTADEIIKKHIEKTGGIKAWKAIKSIKKKSLWYEHRSPVLLKEISTKEKYISMVEDYRGRFGEEKKYIEVAFDGKTMWGVANYDDVDEVEKYTNEADIEEMKYTIANIPSPFIDYKAKGFKYELLGEQNIEGIDCYKLKQVYEKTAHITTTVFISKKSYFKIATEEELDIDNKHCDIRNVFSNFKKVNGIILPHTVICKENKNKGREIELSYKINSKIDDSIFEFKE
jgi:outer membrane lipoprotein-sorting protein